MSVTPSQFEMLRKSLDAVAMRHQCISQNLANVNTPGYKATEVTFEEQLTKTLSAGDNVDQLQPKLEMTPGLQARSDGNNVDIDQEVTELGKNSLRYETYTQLLATKLSMMRSAITGR